MDLDKHKKSCKKVSHFTKLLQYIIYIHISHDIIQKLNCFIGHFNVKVKQNLVEIILLTFSFALK